MSVEPALPTLCARRARNNRYSIIIEITELITELEITADNF